MFCKCIPERLQVFLKSDPIETRKFISEYTYTRIDNIQYPYNYITNLVFISYFHNSSGLFSPYSHSNLFYLMDIVVAILIRLWVRGSSLIVHQWAMGSKVDS